MFNIVRGTSLAVILAMAGPVWAADPIEQHNSNAFWFENFIGLSNAQLKVTAPNGEIIVVEAASGTPVFQLSGAEALDGIYRYELGAATSELVKIVNPVDNGRGDAARDTKAKPFYTSGHFTVSRGVIITPEDIQEGDDG
ncbi:hypothetical protein [Aestuariivita sp.]|uniref:hypothetical protein n=1 Tax=Aestuariivita sp. TaxID=1872407 RepID=UPI002173DCC5|nr:hypothetical protein [Aestuariivita sp.]MCE8008758.1 hypothetical protein [Aestuariivita sp.]